MKNLRTLLLAATVFIGGLSIANAQDKIAHVDTQEIVKTYPAYQAAKAEAEKLAKTMTASDEVTFNDMYKTMEQTAAKYRSEAGTQTDAVNQQRSTEIEKMNASIAQFQQDSQRKVMEAQQKKMAPVGEKIKAAINKVANTLGYKYVMDKAGLIVANGKDITPEVKKELGY